MAYGQLLFLQVPHKQMVKSFFAMWGGSRRAECRNRNEALQGKSSGRIPKEKKQLHDRSREPNSSNTTCGVSCHEERNEIGLCSKHRPVTDTKIVFSITTVAVTPVKDHSRKTLPPLMD